MYGLIDVWRVSWAFFLLFVGSVFPGSVFGVRQYFFFWETIYAIEL